jgi:lipopolysaccharide export system protein LptA
LTLILAGALCPAAFGQIRGDKPLTEQDLLKQIESVAPTRPTVAGKNEPSAGSLFDALGDPLPTGREKKDKAPEKKAKGPTEITALEATFDQKANLAVFTGEVVVKDPEFNVICDKLTAHLKGKPAAGAPKPAPPVPGPDGKTPKAKGGGLERAVAESTSDRRVIITQEKMDADGNLTESIGKADKATYDVVSGDIVLYGSPEVIQGVNRVQATEAGTIMTLNRDGRMKAVGAVKTTIVDAKSDSR